MIPCAPHPPEHIVTPQYMQAYSTRICKLNRRPPECMRHMRIPPPLRQEQYVDAMEKFPEPLHGVVLYLLSHDRTDDVAYLIEHIDVYMKILALYDQTFSNLPL